MTRGSIRGASNPIWIHPEDGLTKGHIVPESKLEKLYKLVCEKKKLN